MVCAVLAFILILIKLPETKDKTIDEIPLMLKHTDFNFQSEFCGNSQESDESMINNEINDPLENTMQV